MKNDLKTRAAMALDLTHGMDDRGPRTYNARKMLAEWLDTGRGTFIGIRQAIEWLQGLIDPGQR